MADPTAAIQALKAQGAPDEAIHAYLVSKGFSPVEDTPKEGLGGRVASKVGSGLAQLAHPLDLIGGMAKSASDAFLAPGVGEARHSAALSKGGNSSGRPIDVSPYDAEHGGVTNAQRTAGGLQTAAAVAFPGMAGLGEKVASRVASGGIAKAIGMAGAGATAGAASDPSDPLAGALAGGVLAPALHGTAKGVGKLTSGTGSFLLDNVLGRPVESRPLVQMGPVKFGHIEGQDARAVNAVQSRAQMDAASGHVPGPSHRSLPPLALDQAGPNVAGLAEGIANRPGPGRAIIQNTVEGRMKQMRPALTNELEQGTGVPADARMGLSEDAIAERSRVAHEMYGAAREATRGQPVDSPTFDAIKKTPAGQAAYAWAKAQMANRQQKLPTVTETKLPDLLQQMVDEAKPGDRAGMIEKFGHTDAAEQVEREVPDPETLHYMKQHLAKTARLGVQDGAQGLVSTGAQGALGLWDQIRSELPDVFRQADETFAEHSRRIDAMDAGRNIYRTPLNPAGPARRAIPRSLDGVESKMAKATPEEQGAFQQGAATAAHGRLQSASFGTKSPGRIFASSPERIEQTGHAFPSPDKAADFQQAVAAWDHAQAQSQKLLGGSPTALRGAEGSGAGGQATTNAILGGKRAAIKAIIKSLGSSVRTANQQALEGEIAKILTSKDLSALPASQRVSAVQSRVLGAANAGQLTAATRSSDQP